MNLQKNILPNKNSPPKKGDKRKLIPIALLAVLGIVLLSIGNFVNIGGKTPSSSDDILSADKYVEMQEQKIAALCERVSGVYDVSVAVSIDGGYEYVYAQNLSQKQRDGTYEAEYRYVIVGGGSSQNVVIISKNPPKINGVAVVCRGGGNPEIQQRLIYLISAAYDIGTNKIYIAEAKNQ